jgi:hypothetical protein
MTQASVAVTEAARALVPTPAESHDTASVNYVTAWNGFGVLIWWRTHIVIFQRLKNMRQQPRLRKSTWHQGNDWANSSCN